LGAAVCAALREETGAADALLVRVAERARSAGRRRCDRIFVDLSSGRGIRISWNGGDLAQRLPSRSERADGGGGADRAGDSTRLARSRDPQQVRQGGGGGGRRRARRDRRGAGSRRPVLIGVAAAYAPALREFAGDLCAFAADEAAVWRWLGARLGERAPFGEREAVAP